MKARMPCSECKSRGQLSYGHWHTNPTCPFYQKNKGGSDKTSKKSEKDVFVVSQTLGDDEDSECKEEAVYAVMMVDSTGSGMHGITMCQDSCWGSVDGGP